jgi:hypothetical protein
METKPIITVAFVAVGVVVLASFGLGLLTPGKPLDFFGLNIANGDGRFIPPVAGALAFIAGIIWLLVKSKRAP